MTITRISDTDFSVTTDTALADGSLRSDSCCRIVDAELRSHEQRGYIRTGGLLRVTLGPKSLVILRALPIGESVTFGKTV